jgi:tetratricopeptide (TPR) repeat protein
VLAAVLALAGCRSAEERAEDFYRSGLELLAAGDEDRAMLEFRNVFQHDGFHKEARLAYAGLLLKRGELREAYGQYLRLIEQYPDTLEARLILAETAISLGTWDEVERHGRAAAALAPDAPRVRAVLLALDYRAAVLARDSARRTALAEEAAALGAELPASLVLAQVRIDHLVAGPDPRAALAEIEAALALAPGDYQLHGRKLQLLGRLEDVAGVGAQLRTMVALFPGDADLKTALVRWHLTTGDPEGAEAVLRAEAEAEGAGPPARLALVQFLDALRGRAVAREELSRQIAAAGQGEDTAVYIAFLATMDFEEGRQAEAVAAIEALLAETEASDRTRDLQTLLARMVDAGGDRARAETLVAEVLAADAANVDALKLRAAWAIAADRPGEAILDLRTAQGQAPRDPRIMTLLAAAFERDGNLDLAGEQLAKAVEASGAAPEESLRYARFLRQQGRAGVAETVLAEARRSAPAHPEVLGLLAEVLLEAGKWPQAQEVAETLRSLGRPETEQTAQEIAAAVLLGQNRIEEGIALLETQAAGGDARSVAVVVATQLRAGKAAQARAFLDAELARAPQDPGLRLLGANVDAILGRTAEAEAAYRALIADLPQADLPVRMLLGLLRGAGRAAEAGEVLDAALERMPEAPVLLGLKAAALEAADDFEGAIALHERLYAQDSTSIIAANNLASMMATYRSDEASLERAAAIARRLRDSPVPAFRDTYGWIEFRRGNIEEALRHLEPAAEGLPDDAVVQFHLGMVYDRLGRREEAARQFRRALDLGEGRALPQLETARARLAGLAAAPPAPGAAAAP